MEISDDMLVFSEQIYSYFARHTEYIRLTEDFYKLDSFFVLQPE